MSTLYLHKGYNDCYFHHSVTERSNPDDTAFGYHCHDKHELLYIVHGSGKVTVESTEYPLIPGSVFLFRKSEWHHVIPDVNTQYERYVINFASCAINKAAAELAILDKNSFCGNGVFYPPESVSSAVRSAFISLDAKDLFRETEGPIGEAMISALTTQILILLSLREPASPPEQKKSSVAYIMEYLNDHFTEDISLDEIAQKFYISKSYMCRIFKKHIGVSVYHYINSKRIALAQRLLTEETPAYDVAFRVGFKDYSSFYRTYRKMSGKSPVYLQRHV